VCICCQSKKPNAAQPFTKKTSHEPKSPDSSVSSNPSSPVSSLKSVPVMHSRQSAISKLRAARETQIGSKATTLHDEVPASPGSSSVASDSPRNNNRKTANKKPAPAQKLTSPATEMLVVTNVVLLYYSLCGISLLQQVECCFLQSCLL